MAATGCEVPAGAYLSACGCHDPRPSDQVALGRDPPGAFQPEHAVERRVIPSSGEDSADVDTYCEIARPDRLSTGHTLGCARLRVLANLPRSWTDFSTDQETATGNTAIEVACPFIPPGPRQAVVALGEAQAYECASRRRVSAACANRSSSRAASCCDSGDT